jgi:hypothetical protein
MCSPSRVNETAERGRGGTQGDHLTKRPAPPIIGERQGGVMEKVRKREGLVCVCAECNKVIGGVGVVSPGGTPRIGHGICPECAARLYGDIFRGERGTRRR